MWRLKRLTPKAIILAFLGTIIVLASLWWVLGGHFSGWRGYRDHRLSRLDGWHSISGNWSLSNNVISNAHYGRGDMLIASSFRGNNYKIAADLRFDLLFPETHYGDAGLVIRVSDPQRGVDSYRGYYAGLRPDSQTLVLGRASYDWLTLKELPLAVPVAKNEWYHIELSARGCDLSVEARPIPDGPPTRIDYHDANCLTDGMGGLRSFYTQASWRSVTMTLSDRANGSALRGSQPSGSPNAGQ
ncbi:MAG: hypothetical protein FWD64_06350 [Acidobacteriaceae bacterium]|nr:hypothetical protein [Acidobacteriaceae bacterium]